MELRALTATDVKHNIKLNPQVKKYGRLKSHNKPLTSHIK